MRYRKGFTLVELLVVVVIIAVLMGMLLPAIWAAVRRAREAAAVAEINMLGQGLANFQAKYGCYPPSRVVLSETGDYSAAYLGANLSITQKGEGLAVVSRSVNYLRRIWPRMQLSTSGAPGGIPGGFYDFNGDGVVSPPVVIHGDECLVLFLGGAPVKTASGWGAIGFANNPVNPFLPGSQNRMPMLHDFDANRLVDINSNGFPSFVDSIGGKSSPVAYSYFCGYDGSYDPDDVNVSESDGTATPPLLGGFEAPGDPQNVGGIVSSPSPNPYTAGYPVAVNGSGHLGPGHAARTWIKPQSYQIICAGYDRIYGIGGLWKNDEDSLAWMPLANQDVTGQTLIDRNAERDNLTNFYGTELGK